MPEPVPNPLQPILNQLTRVACLLERYIGQSPESSVVVVAPRKAGNAVYGRRTIGTTPTLIAPANNSRVNIAVVNGGANTIFVGSDNRVTTDMGDSPGYELLAQGTLDNDTYTGALWGVVAHGTIDVTIWEEFE